MAHHQYHMLDGSRKSEGAMRECSKCGELRDPHGGIEMSPGKWRCATCWRLFNSIKKK